MPDNAEAEIRDLIGARAAAINAAELEGMMAQIADDVVSFDVTGELSVNGKAAVRESATAWLGLYEGPPHWEDRNVAAFAVGDADFAHMLSHVTGHRKDGVDVDMWFRTTLGLRRIDGEWRVIHEHQSDPFDPDTGNASLDIKP